MVEVDPSVPMLVSIAYPPSTSITVQYSVLPFCDEVTGECSSVCDPDMNLCVKNMESASSIDEVRNGTGEKYHFSSEGVLTIRIISMRRI